MASSCGGEGLARPRSSAAGGPPPTPECRCRHHAGDDVVVDHQGDQRGPNRDTAQIALGAVDRVDHPAARSPALGAELLTNDRVSRSGPGEHAADPLLRRPVGVGDRSRVGLGVDAQVTRPEPLHGLRVGVVGKDVREPEVVVIAHERST